MSTTTTQVFPQLEVTKTAVVSDVNSNSINDLGDIITYTIRIENKGNVSLSALTISDTLTDGNTVSLTLTTLRHLFLLLLILLPPLLQLTEF